MSVDGGSGPTVADLTKIIMQMKQEMQQMRGGKLKVPLPDQFDGTRGKLKNFMAQADTYLKYNGHLLPTDSDKVTLIGSRLTGPAFNFYQPYYQDFMKYDSEQQEDSTKDIFNSYDFFKKRLSQQFGNIDEKREAERKIVNLRQTGSMSHYVSEFQQLLGHLNWADGPAIVQFYQGMKEDVKDQFMLIDRPTEISEMQMKAIEIDNRLYERRLEKRGRFVPQHQKDQKKSTWNNKAVKTTATGTHAGPMDIDSQKGVYQVHKKENDKKERQKKPLTDQQKKWLAEKACLKCGQQGHWANKCETKTVNMVKRMDTEVQEEIKHAYLHWTSCTDNECNVHRSSKENAGWMPQKFQARSKEDIEDKEWRYHNSLHGRRCRMPQCTIPHHQEWSLAKDLQEKRERHETLDAKECIRNYCYYHGIPNEKEQQEPTEGLACLKYRCEEHNRGPKEELLLNQEWIMETKEEEHQALSAHECFREVCEAHGTKQVAIIKNKGPTYPYLETQTTINGREITAIIDSGSTGNFIDPGIVKELGLIWDVKTYPYSIIGADGTGLGATGKVTGETSPITYTIEGRTFIEPFDILPMGTHGLMFGMPWLREHNPIVDWTMRTIHFGSKPPTYQQAIMQVQEIQEIPAEYQDLQEAFKELIGKEALPEHQEWDLTIPLKPGTQPPNENLRRTDSLKAQQIREFLDDRLSKGWIEESKSPCGCNVLFVPKKDGEDRLCCDLRGINNITIKDSHPLPLIAEIQDRLSKAIVFTKLDIKDAYHQVRIKEGEEWKTAFKTRYGTYQWKVMPFGLTNAPACFQRLINTALKGYLDIFCTAYLDDIIIYSEQEENHTEHVRKVLKRLIQWKLRLKLKKCEFRVKETTFLGHILRPGEIDMESKKVKDILEWPTPRSVKDVQSFLGLGNYYRKFIRNYSKIAVALTSVSKNGQEFRWENGQEQAFRALKEAFTSAPVLKLYNPDKPIVIETDASDYADGAVLNQWDEDGKLHPVMFHSRKFGGAEINYDVHDKELLAIVDALKVWEVYVNSNPHEIQIYTDHKNLQTFMTTKELTRRHMRWAERIGHVKFRIIYRKGSENARADALSRRIDYKPDSTKQSYQLLKQEEDGSITYANPQVMQIYRLAQEVDQELIDAYQKDSMYAELKTRSTTEHQIHTSADGYLRYFGKVYVPARQVHRIIREQHDAPGAGHQGFKRTHDRIKNRYYFPKMKQIIKEHIDTCIECCINKPSRHRPYGEMGEYRIPEAPFQEVAMDWIVKLPLSKDPLTQVKFDSIMVIVDRFTKYAKFVPYLEKSSTEALAYSFTKHIIADHGMPKSIISDRDKWLTSNFWQSLMKSMGSKQVMTSAYHPQANGQAERLNQTLEQYLRHYLNVKQDNWVELLPVAQYAYNSATAEATGSSPFEALYGRIPTMYNEPVPDNKPAANAQTWTQEAKETQEQLQLDLKFQQIQMAKYYDKKRSSAPILKKGGKVFLLRRNIKTKRPSDKLDHQKIGPFEVMEKIGNNHYRLDLPSKMRIHPIFHIALLEPAPQRIPVAKNTEVEPENDIYKFERILDHRGPKGDLEYLVKWEGYTSSENTWEPAKNFSPKAIKQYHQYLDTARKTNLQEGPFPRTRREREIKQTQKLKDQVHRVLMIRRIDWGGPPPQRPLRQPFQASPSLQWTPTLGQTASLPGQSIGWHPSVNEDDEPREYVSDSEPSHDGRSQQRIAAPPPRSLTPHPGTLLQPGLVSPERPREACPTFSLGKQLARDVPLDEIILGLGPVAAPGIIQLQNIMQGMSEESRLSNEIITIRQLAEQLVNKWMESEDPDQDNAIYDKIQELGHIVENKQRRLQSLSVTTRSHLAFRDRHSEQLPESRLIRQVRPEDLQEEQGVGISRPKRRTRPNKFERRTVDDVLGMTGQRKRKHERILEGDSAHLLYPREQPATGYDGYRDAIPEEEGAVLKGS
jgi:hypothetical protein